MILFDLLRRLFFGEHYYCPVCMHHTTSTWMMFRHYTQTNHGWINK